MVSNTINYSNISATQVKISVKPEVAQAFKAACVANNISMAAILSDFMSQYGGAAVQKGNYAPNLSTRRQRRSALQAIIHQLERIMANEEAYMNNIPVNLQSGNAFEVAEQCVSTLAEALDLLGSAY